MAAEIHQSVARRAAILRLIRESTVHNQDELAKLLRKQGFEATQSSVSRDLRELGVAKAGDHYILPGGDSSSAGTPFAAVANPFLGRFSDRRGRLLPIRIALAASVAVALAFAFARDPYPIAVLTVLAAITFGAFYTPGMALVSDRTETVGLSQAIGFGIMNTAWALGNMTGPALAGTIAEATSDAVPYALAALLCLVTLAATGIARAPMTRRVADGGSSAR